MPTTDLLKAFGLSKNPFTDRTAENTSHDETSLYIHSDLRGFRPNDTTYVFFGRRGSGKTTIRLQMEEAYRQYNKQVGARLAAARLGWGARGPQLRGRCGCADGGGLLAGGRLRGWEPAAGPTSRRRARA
jgi:hypothetical protein